MDQPRTLRLLGPTGPIGEWRCGSPHDDGADGDISDEELTAMALAADPDAPLGDDAIPLSLFQAIQPGPLPEWYMPATATRARRWRWPVVVPLVFAFLLIASFGLCATYGFLTPG
jgi:hypothetical protein